MIKMRVTLKDVAKASGVSTNTVSKVFRDDRSIPDETKARIKKIASKIGYVPNLSAKTLRTGKSMLVGILYGDLLNPYFSIMSRLLNNKLKEINYSTLFFVEPRVSCMMEIDVALKMIQHNVDAVITFMIPTTEVKELMENYRIPVVVIGRDSSEIGVDCVYANDYQGGFLAGKYFLDCGHKDILIFTQNAPFFKQRLKGFKEALISGGISEENIQILVQLSEVSQDVERYVSLGNNHFTAVFCVNDMLAMQTLTCLRTYEEFKNTAVIGYDYIQSTFKVFDKLTTIDTNKEKMIDLAVDIMKRKISGENEKMCYQVDVKLVKGITA